MITYTDRTVYVKFKDVDYSTLSDFSSPITLDFETSADFDLEIMWSSQVLLCFLLFCLLPTLP